MSPVISLLLMMSLSLIAVGYVLLFTARHDELREFSPAELSTSAPVPRSCWARVQAVAARRVVPVRRRRPSGPREVVLELAEISAARTMYAGRVPDMSRSESGRGSAPGC